MSLKRRKNKNLEQLFKKYVTPTLLAINTYEDGEELRRRTIFPGSHSKKNARSFAHLPKFAVTHEEKLYPSVDASKEILVNNRNTFHEMTSTLKQLEWNSYRKQIKSISAQKTKLDFFKERVRKSPERCGIFYLRLYIY